MSSAATRAPAVLALVLVAWLAGPLPLHGAGGTTRELVAVLESDASLQDKAIACRELGEFGSAEAVPALAALLDHEVLAAYARTGLERIPDPSAAAALRSALETTRGELLVGVITSLGALRDVSAVAALSDLVRADDASAAEAALLALGRIASPDAVAVVRTALASGSPGAGAAALLAAESQRVAGREEAALALYDAVRTADVSEASRLGALRGAILIRGSVPFLVEHLSSADASVRAVALLAIREMPSDALADALHARLRGAPPELRVPLIAALRDCHNGASFGVVRSQLGSDAPAIRRAALGTLGAIGQGAELATTLLDVVRDRRSPAERETALGLLERMEGGAEVDRVLLERLRQARAADMRVDVIRILGERRTAGAVGDLLRQARGHDPRVRVAALRSLRRLVGPQDVPSLIALVKTEEHPPARTAAIQALIGACGDDGPSSERVLAELEQTSDPVERDAWIRALTATGYPGALPALRESLESDEAEIVATTIDHLSRWPDPSPVDALLPFLEGGADPTARRRAVSAVIRLTKNAADRGQRPEAMLVEWLARAAAAVETVSERRLLLSGLARVHTPDSLRLLGPHLRDPEVRTEALYALLSIGSTLVEDGHHAAVAEVLPGGEAIDDPELRSRIERLREQVEDATRTGEATGLESR